MLANGVEDTMAVECWNQLFQEKCKKTARDDRQVEIVDLECGVELEGLLVLHELTAAEDNDVVAHQSERGPLEGGERGR